MKRLGTSISVSVAAMLLLTAAAIAAPARDSVSGSGLATTYFNQPLNFSATSNPAGHNAQGTFDNGHYAGTVTCLNVTGSRSDGGVGAVVGGVVTSTANDPFWVFPVGTGVIFSVIDYGTFGPNVFADRFAQVSIPGPATAQDCRSNITLPVYSFVNGNITVTDAK
jgi:hypothetical protein